MHVGGLSLFEPAGDPDEFARSLRADMIAEEDAVSAPFRRTPARFLSTFSAVRWQEVEQVDLDFHVRLLSLPKPGRIRELLELVSMLHSSLLDRHRPLWEVYIITGMADGRVAVFSKTHHALMDGVTAVRTWQRALTDDPAARDCVPPWRARRARSAPDSGRGLDVVSSIRSVSRLIGSAPDLVAGAYGLTRGWPEPLPFSAPRTMFNVPITGGRRFAAQSWPLARLRAIGASTGSTLNDVVLAMCAGALRRYLTAADALPERPLIAMVPISLRQPGAPSEGGNAVGAALCDLGTDVADPLQRLERIRASMTRTKSMLANLTPLQVLGVSAMNVAGLAVPAVPVLAHAGPPPFNIVVSNVPGREQTQYWNGVRLGAVYPASIPLDGQAVNITTISSGGSMHFGIVGCRRSVPHLQRLLIDLEDSLLELEVGS